MLNNYGLSIGQEQCGYERRKMARIHPAIGARQRQQFPAVEMKARTDTVKQKHVQPGMHKIRQVLEIIKMTQLQTLEAKQQQIRGRSRMRSINGRGIAMRERNQEPGTAHRKMRSGSELTEEALPAFVYTCQVYPLVANEMNRVVRGNCVNF
ncbi:MAG: hypothetical protein ACRER2_15505 [Methylococcales bacterium]